jgi:hypothetical protein
MAAIASMPAHSDTLTGLESRNTRSQCFDGAYHLMSGHARILGPRYRTALRKDIAVADTASLDLDPDISRPGLRNLTLDKLKRPVGPGDLDDAHLFHKFSPQGKVSELAGEFTKVSWVTAPGDRSTYGSKATAAVRLKTACAI